MNNEKVKTFKKSQKIKPFEQQVDKNLRHGYVFLIGTILTLFFISLGTELYIRHNYIKEIEIFNVFEEDEVSTEEVDLPEITIDGMEDGFSTKDKTLTIKGNVDREADVTINDEDVETYKIFGSKRYFDHKVDLKPGKNEITIKATDLDGTTSEKTITITYELDSYPIVELSLQCTTLKPKFNVGEKIVFNCELTDQDRSEIQDAGGTLTIHWDSGIQKYTFEGNDLHMIFEVPENNQGKIQGQVEIEHELMEASSHFIFMID